MSQNRRGCSYFYLLLSYSCYVSLVSRVGDWRRILNNGFPVHDASHRSVGVKVAIWRPSFYLRPTPSQRRVCESAPGDLSHCCISALSLSALSKCHPLIGPRTSRAHPGINRLARIASSSSFQTHARRHPHRFREATSVASAQEFLRYRGRTRPPPRVIRQRRSNYAPTKAATACRRRCSRAVALLWHQQFDPAAHPPVHPRRWPHLSPPFGLGPFLW